MSVGYFTEKSQPPSPAELQEALGSLYPLWERLVQFMAETYQLAADFNYGGKNYGWNLWYRKSGKALLSLYPQQECMVAQVVLGKDQVETALAADLGEKAGRMLRETPQLHDGKWLFIPVTDETDLKDVQQLLLIKKRPARRKGPGPSLP